MADKPFAIYKRGELHYIGMHNGLMCLPVRVSALSASTKESNQ